jgi:predicted metalloprotease with PDZ domain
VDIETWLKPYVYTCEVLPFRQLFAQFGLKLVPQSGVTFASDGVVIKEKNSKITPAKELTDIGCKLVKTELGYKILHIYENSIAAKSDLAPNDIILALNKVKLSNWERQILLCAKAKMVELTIFRRELLMTIKVNLKQKNSVNIYDLKIVNIQKLSAGL